MTRRLIAAAFALALTGCTPADRTAAPSPEPAATPGKTAAEVAASPAADPALARFLEARTTDAIAPLAYAAGADGPLTFVLLSGPEYCGSGGCKLLILERDGDGFTVLGDTTVTRAPIRVLDSSSHGRPDVGVRVAGGGGEAYEARLSFDGTRYPSNPTVAPARRVDGAPGRVVIDEDAARTPLKE